MYRIRSEIRPGIVGGRAAAGNSWGGGSAQNQLLLRRILTKRGLGGLKRRLGRLNILGRGRRGSGQRWSGWNMRAALLFPHLLANTRQGLLYLQRAGGPPGFVEREQAHYKLIQLLGNEGIELAHRRKGETLRRVIRIAIRQAAV